MPTRLSSVLLRLNSKNRFSCQGIEKRLKGEEWCEEGYSPLDSWSNTPFLDPDSAYELPLNTHQRLALPAGLHESPTPPETALGAYPRREYLIHRSFVLLSISQNITSGVKFNI